MMKSYTVKNIAFRGTVGYTHTATLNMAEIIGHGILDAKTAQDCEIITSFGNTFVIGHFEIKEA